MARQAVLAIDEGTTGVTALVLDEGRRVVARAYLEVACHYPRPGWVEQDAAAVWRTTRQVAKAALRAASGQAASGRTASGRAPSGRAASGQAASGRAAARGAGSLAAIGIANQRETTVLWDRRTGAPVAPAIVWQDRRTAERCAQLKAEGWEAVVRRRTGLVIDPYFSATKLEWLLSRRGLRERAQAGRLAFGTMDSWLAWNLTGSHVTDPTNASRTMLWDIRKGHWDAELLDLFGIPEAVLPEVVPSAHPFGVTGSLGAAAPVAALVGDQQAALLGAGCLRPGQAKNTYGTGCFLLQHTGSAAVSSRHGLVTTRAASLDGRPAFALEGSVFTAGAAIQWLRDQLGILEAAGDADVLAEAVEDSAGVLVVPAFSGLGAPHWDPDARGAILGLTRGSDRRHLARAVLESIAFQSADLVAAMQKDSGRRILELRVDGGATRSRPLLQMQADLLQRPVVRPADVETTARGAGLLAGLATGVWGAADLAPSRQGEVRAVPRMGRAEAGHRMRTWQAAVAAARAFKPAPRPRQPACAPGAWRPPACP